MRDSWANETLVPNFRMKRIFIVGSPSKLSVDENIKLESEEHGDILQGGFKDSYRNMTYKHLLGYRWVKEHCTKVDYVLKTDDDQFVDTLQLPRFLSTFLPESNRKWYLCQVLDNAPERHVTSKWYVTREEWPGDSYPLYCAGWAYVTTIPTIEQALLQSSQAPYFWIDDLHVTGVLAQGKVELYNWRYSFLSYHVHMKQSILSGSFYTPELMVCGDVTPRDIVTVFRKASNCRKHKCYNLVYDNHQDAIAPQLMENRSQRVIHHEL